MRADFLLKLDLANRFRGQAIWYPFNVDFRGRAYPIPPYLHHVGGDLSRGLLKVRLARTSFVLTITCSLLLENLSVSVAGSGCVRMLLVCLESASDRLCNVLSGLMSTLRKF